VKVGEEELLDRWLKGHGLPWFWLGKPIIA